MIWFESVGAVPVKRIWLVPLPSAVPCAMKLTVAPVDRLIPALVRSTPAPRPVPLFEVMVELPEARLIVPSVSVEVWAGTGLPVIERLALFSVTFGLLLAPKRLLRLTAESSIDSEPFG